MFLFQYLRFDDTAIFGFFSHADLCPDGGAPLFPPAGYVSAKGALMSGLTLRSGVTFGSLAFLAIVPPLTGAMDAPFVLDIVMRMLCLAIAAISLNLILGYGGRRSFGHAAYIGIGASAGGIPA